MGIVGGGYALIEDGDVTDIRMLGRVAPGGQALTEETLFRFGSVSKNVTSLLAITLIGEGKLSLDAKVSDLLPDMSIGNVWETEVPLQLVHLLEHTGGLPGSSYADYAAEAGDMAPSEYVMSSRFDLRWAPGRYYSYANSGHTIAAAAMEHLTGEAFDDLVADNVFEPIGMRTATFRNSILDDVRLSQSWNADGSHAEVWRLPVRPSGALVGTIRDLAALTRFHATAGADTNIDPALVRRMRLPETSLAAEQGYELSYGLGMFGFLIDGHVFWGHWGRVDGFLTNFGVLPDHRRGFALISNTGNRAAMNAMRSSIASYLTRDVTSAETPPAAQLQDAERLVGWYQPFTDDMVLRSWMTELLGLQHVSLREGDLYLQGLLPGSAERKLTPVSDRFFVEPGVPVPTQLFLDDGGDIVLFGDGQNSFKHISSLSALAQISGLALVVLSVVGSIAAAVISLLWTAWRRALSVGSAMAMTLGLAGFSLLALQGLHVLWGMVSTLDAAAGLGVPGMRALTLLALSIVWPIAAVVAFDRLRRSWQAIGWIMRSWSILTFAGFLLAAGFLASRDWLPLITWSA
ncbi:MAG: serine hydrolase domain-containing protein [Pseudomonadota bacterium]